MATWHSKHHTWLTGKESTYGTAVTANKDWGLIQSFSPTDKRAYQELYATGARTVQQFVAGLVEFDWELSLFVQNGRPFEYILGAPTHAQTSSDWKHTFGIDTSLSSFTIEDSFNGASDNVFIYDGNKITSATVQLDKDGLLTMNATGKAQSVSTATASASAAVISTLDVLHYKHFTLSTGAAGSETSAGKIQTFSLTFENNNEGIPSAGSTEYQEIVEKNFKISFEYTMAFENLTEYKKFLGGTNNTPQVSPASFSTVFNAHNGVTLGSGRREFYAQVDTTVYSEVGTPIQVGEIVIQTFRGMGKTFGSNGCYYVDNVSSASFS